MPVPAIPELGPLRPDVSIDEWVVSDPVPLPLLDGLALPFVLEDVETDAAPQDFADAVRAFLALGAADRDAAAPRVWRYYRWFTDLCERGGYDVDWAPIATPAQVWAHVQPNEVMVTRGGDPSTPVHVKLSCNCAWEVEHGLQLVWRGGRELVRVSDIDGHLEGGDLGAGDP